MALGAPGEEKSPTHLPNGTVYRQSGCEPSGGQPRGNTAGTDMSGENSEDFKDVGANPDGSCISGRPLLGEGATGNASSSAAGKKRFLVSRVWVPGSVVNGRSGNVQAQPGLEAARALRSVTKENMMFDLTTPPHGELQEFLQSHSEACRTPRSCSAANLR